MSKKKHVPLWVTKRGSELTSGLAPVRSNDDGSVHSPNSLKLKPIYAQTLIVVALIVVNLFSFFNFTRNGLVRF